MFIDPLTNKPLLQDLEPQRDRGLPPNHAQFEQLLDSVMEQAEQLDQLNAQTQLKVLLETARLQLFQGLFDTEARQGDDLFGGMQMLPSISPGQAGQQYATSRYIEQQPVVAEQPCEQVSIEQMIDQIAAEVRLSPELIHSVVATESDYQPQAVSPVGAEGLMQLMPETARELGVQDSFDPLQNLRGGSRYLKQLLDKYDGDLDRALAAYNWGQGNLDRKGLEQMPQETRDYLARVKGRLVGKA